MTTVPSPTKWVIQYNYEQRPMKFHFKTKKEAAQYINELPVDIGLVQFYPVYNGNSEPRARQSRL